MDLRGRVVPWRRRAIRAAVLLFALVETKSKARQKERTRHDAVAAPSRAKFGAQCSVSQVYHRAAPLPRTFWGRAFENLRCFKRQKWLQFSLKKQESGGPGPHR